MKASAKMTSFPAMKKLAALKRRSKEKHDFVPRERGFRCMTVLHKPGEPEPVLCVSTMSHWGSRLMVSEDGEQFTPISEAGLGNPDILSFRWLIPFRGKLFIAPVGTVKQDVLQRNMSDIARLYVADDPFSGDWHEAIEPGFGDSKNLGIFSLNEFDGYLYAGTSNPFDGFQIWRTRAEGRPPYEWEPVMAHGAYRYNLNHTAATLVPFKGKLYVSSALPGLGKDNDYDVGPAAAELLRIDTDNSWELLAGTPRFTPDGLKVPISLQGPGLDDAENSVFWSVAEHDGCLYAGSHHNAALKHALAGDDEIVGGFQFFGTEDGETWEPITLDGFGDPYSVGVRTLASTPDGFFLGTLNHRDVEKLWLLRRGRFGEEPGKGGFAVYRARNGH